MSNSKDVYVVSSFGDIITYEEHLNRLRVYIEEIKSEAIGITKANSSLTAFISSLRIVAGEELRVDPRSCRFFLTIESKLTKVVVPTSDSWKSSVILDAEGHPLLMYQFSFIKDSMRYRLVYDYFMPKLVRRNRYFQEFIKKTITEQLRWVYVANEKRGKCLEMTFNYREPDVFWLVLNYNVTVLIGNFNDIVDALSELKNNFWNGGLMIVDLDYKDIVSEEMYQEILKDFNEIKTWVWNANTFAFMVFQKFRDFPKEIDAVFQIGTSATFHLGDLLSDSDDIRDELIRELRLLPSGDNVPHEELVKRILIFCFKEEFAPFNIDEQARTHNNERIRDFIIPNTTAKEIFWRDLKLKDEITIGGEIKMKRGVKLILFDAKNYQGEIEYDSIAYTINGYLVNRFAFGNFMIIISRHGLKEDKGQLYDHLLAEGKVVLSLNDNDLIEMIQLKREGKSPTIVIAKKYYDFLKKK